MVYNSLVCCIFVFSMYFTFFSKKLLCLMTLEIYMVSVICCYMVNGHFYHGTMALPLYMFVMMVSGSVLGISILVLYSRGSGGWAPLSGGL